jgi:predicted dehydrogenase
LHFERANLEAASLARAGKLGELRYFSSDFSQQVRAGNIRLERARGGGPLSDIGIYCINAARYCLSDEPTAVFATAIRGKDPRFREVDETVIATMRFKGDRLACFTCSFGAADRSTYAIVGTNGVLTLDPAYEYAEGLHYRMKVGEHTRSRKFAKSDQFAAELLYFSDCVLNDREPEPSGQEGLQDVRIIEGMQRSIATGRWTVLEQPRKRRGPTLRQAVQRPPVRQEPKLVGATASSR